MFIHAHSKVSPFFGGSRLRNLSAKTLIATLVALLAAGSVSLPFEAQASHEQHGQAVVSIDASSGFSSGQFSLVLDQDGRIFAAGTNQSGQLGTGDNLSSATPRQVFTSGVLAEKKIIAVSAGGNHALALDVDGLVYAWGYNQAGQLGDGTNVDSNVPFVVDLAEVPTGRKIVKIAAGPGHSAAIDELGTVYTWGENAQGQLGDTTTANKSTPVSLSGAGALAGLKVAEVSLGGGTSYMGTSGFTVAVSDTGVLVAWGYNGNGELGDGTTDQRTSPVLVDALVAIKNKVIKSVSSGDTFSVAIDSEGKAYAWGLNDFGQLGDGSTNSRLSPVAVDVSGVLNGKELVQVAAGGEYTLALDDEGTVFAWGSNASGQLGDGSLDNSSVPVAVDPATVLSGKKITAIAAGYRSSLALDDSGSVHGWGLDSQGQLGVGLSEFIRSPIAITPAGALAGKTIQKTAFGYFHTLFISEGLIFAAGRNSDRQLGDGSTTDKSSPIASGTGGVVLAGKAFTAIAAGIYHSLALDSAGKVYSWGLNNFGQLGIGSTENSDPTLVGGLIASKTIVAIAAGGYHSLALDSDGVLYSWGYNVNGQLGVGDTLNRTSPVAVDMTGVLSGKTISSIHGADRHSIVLDSAGKAYSWGANSQGELGDTSTIDRNVPVVVYTGGALDGKTVTQLSTAMYHTFALDSAGKIYGWGLNNSGQLGDGTTVRQTAPKLIDAGGISGKTISSVAVGFSYSLALDDEGVAYAWGENFDGQLGLNDSLNRTTPTAINSSGALAGKTITSLSTSFAGSASFATDSAGVLYGWGRNSFFDLGIGDTGKYPIARTTLFSGHVLTLAPPSSVARPYVGPTSLIVDKTAPANGNGFATGNNLETITAVLIDEVETKFVILSDDRISFEIPKLAPGNYSVKFFIAENQVYLSASLEVTPGVEIVSADQKVNAGSFNRYVAVYAKGYAGSTLTWKIAGKWFKTVLTENYHVFQRPTVAVNLPINVELYIDGVRIFQKSVLTK